MNEFERKLYLKYANIENTMQLLCLELYRLRLFIQVNVLLFLFFTFFKRSSGLHSKILSNQLSNSSTISISELNSPSSRQNPKSLTKKI